MGWCDRDWAKFNDDEWDALTSGPAPTGHSRRTRAITLLAALVSLVATAVVLAVHFGAKGPPPAAPARQSSVAVQWSPTDLSLATTSGRICLTDPRRGSFCATYTAGERPADALTRRIEDAGLVVRND
jgi:hypothetical protein